MKRILLMAALLTASLSAAAGAAHDAAAGPAGATVPGAVPIPASEPAETTVRHGVSGPGRVQTALPDAGAQSADTVRAAAADQMPASAQTLASAHTPPPARLPAEKRLDRQALHPRYRAWAKPAGGAAVRQNPAPLLWPAAGDAKEALYRVRLSQDSTFADGATRYEGPFEWAACAVHTPLAPGRWYWQWSVAEPGGAERWSAANAFTVDDTARTFPTPTGAELAQRVAAMPHHRLYVPRAGVGAFRERARRNDEAQEFVRTMRGRLDMPLVPVAPTRPRDTTGMTAFQKRSMINFMYHKFGEVVTQPAVDFSIAYLLTGEEPFARAAVRHALHAAALPVDSDATSEDFNRSAIMYGLAVAYDTACDYMTPSERAAVLEAVRVRGAHFYRRYVKDFECHSMDNHVWQHTFRNFLFAAIATAGDIPEAEKWLRYGYEVWCARFPILGGEDGGWHDGNSYFEANLVSFIYVPFVLSRLTGVDFFDIPWYRNLPGFLVCSFPKDSYATGFGDDYEKCRTPPAQYMGFADALARETGSGEARWYADRLIGDDPAALRKAKTFRLYRLLTDKAIDGVEPVPPAPMTARCYPDAGFSLMHTDPGCAARDLMASFFSVPFGATGHAHAAHNGFTISYGGRQLFGGTGYYSNFNDKHTLMHYRTRGHNTILADGMAQCIGENGYGWLPRFADTPALTYTLGDASHAYDLMRTPFWIDRMKRSGVEYTAANGFGDPGVVRFRRHFVFLKPDIVVLYDELEAREPVAWTWLLHSHNPLTEAASDRDAGSGSACPETGPAACSAGGCAAGGAADGLRDDCAAADGGSSGGCSVCGAVTACGVDRNTLSGRKAGARAVPAVSGALGDGGAADGDVVACRADRKPATGVVQAAAGVCCAAGVADGGSSGDCPVCGAVTACGVDRSTLSVRKAGAGAACAATGPATDLLPDPSPDSGACSEAYPVAGPAVCPAAETAWSRHAVQTANGAAAGRMDLFTAGRLELKLTDEFFSPAVNWKKRAGADGRPLVYSNHAHAEFTTAERSRAQRFLAVFRITPAGCEPLPLSCDGEGRVTVGGWSIAAQLDAAQPASLTVTDGRGNEVLYNTPASRIVGSTLVLQPDGSGRELVDEVPGSVE